MQEFDNSRCQVAHPVSPDGGIGCQHQLITMGCRNLDMFQYGVIEKLAEQGIEALQFQYFVPEFGEY